MCIVPPCLVLPLFPINTPDTISRPKSASWSGWCFLMLTLWGNAKHFKFISTDSMRLWIHWDLKIESHASKLPAHVWIIDILTLLPKQNFFLLFIIKHLILKTFCRKFLHIDLIEKSEHFQHQTQALWKLRLTYTEWQLPFLMEYSLYLSISFQPQRLWVLQILQPLCLSIFSSLSINLSMPLKLYTFQ